MGDSAAFETLDYWIGRQVYIAKLKHDAEGVRWNKEKKQRLAISVTNDQKLRAYDDEHAKKPLAPTKLEQDMLQSGGLVHMEAWTFGHIAIEFENLDIEFDYNTARINALSLIQTPNESYIPVQFWREIKYALDKKDLFRFMFWARRDPAMLSISFQKSIDCMRTYYSPVYDADLLQLNPGATADKCFANDPSYKRFRAMLNDKSISPTYIPIAQNDFLAPKPVLNKKFLAEKLEEWFKEIRKQTLPEKDRENAKLLKDKTDFKKNWNLVFEGNRADSYFSEASLKSLSDKLIRKHGAMYLDYSRLREIFEVLQLKHEQKQLKQLSDFIAAFIELCFPSHTLKGPNEVHLSEDYFPDFWAFFREITLQIFEYKHLAPHKLSALKSLFMQHLDPLLVTDGLLAKLQAEIGVLTEVYGRFPEDLLKQLNAPRAMFLNIETLSPQQKIILIQNVGQKLDLTQELTADETIGVEQYCAQALQQRIEAECKQIAECKQVDLANVQKWFDNLAATGNSACRAALTKAIILKLQDPSVCLVEQYDIDAKTQMPVFKEVRIGNVDNELLDVLVVKMADQKNVINTAYMKRFAAGVCDRLDEFVKERAKKSGWLWRKYDQKSAVFNGLIERLKTTPPESPLHLSHIVAAWLKEKSVISPKKSNSNILNSYRHFGWFPRYTGKTVSLATVQQLAVYKPGGMRKK